MKWLLFVFSAAGLSVSSVLVVGCQTTDAAKESHQPSPFTHGNVQLTLKKGVTTQAEVLETFGSPNIATIDASGQEMWTYEEHATVTTSSESGAYATVVLLGAAGGTSHVEQSSR